VHEIREKFIFLGGQFDRLTSLGDLARSRVEADVAGVELA
jgi:hypothetical protein